MKSGGSDGNKSGYAASEVRVAFAPAVFFRRPTDAHHDSHNERLQLNRRNSAAFWRMWGDR